MPTFSLIDADAMKSVFGDNPDAIYRYLERFVILTSGLLKLINLSIHKQDASLAMKHFHQLKGPVGSIGFKTMYKHCINAEEKILQSDWVAVNDCMKGIEKELNKLDKETKRYFSLRR